MKQLTNEVYRTKRKLKLLEEEGIETSFGFKINLNKTLTQI